MTVGEDRLDASQDVCSPAVSILDEKTHQQHNLSCTQMCKKLQPDVKDFSLLNNGDVSLYAKSGSYTPSEVLSDYNLTPDHFNSKEDAYIKSRKEFMVSRKLPS